jgi:hypothetical protein
MQTSSSNPGRCTFSRPPIQFLVSLIAAAAQHNTRKAEMKNEIRNDDEHAGRKKNSRTRSGILAASAITHVSAITPHDILIFFLFLFIYCHIFHTVLLITLR